MINDFPPNAEYFRAVDGFPAYEISTDGRVRTIKTGRIRKLSVLPQGYMTVGLLNNYKQYKSLYIHILVATAFCNKSDGCNIVDHMDRNPANNNYQNLRWTTISGNNRNTSKPKNNSSGYKGVCFKKEGYWFASWYEEKQKQKAFSVKKYGDQAKQMAIDYRKEMTEKNGYLND